jgi:NitT/TauT family transport system substrate-binding protein
VALHRGLFAEQGLELEVTIPGDGRVVLAGQASGELDVGLGGIMRSLASYDQGEPAAPLHFARLNDRDGFFLLGHSAEFDWPDLLGKRLITFTEAPTPWYILRAHLLERGLDPDRIEVVAGLPAPEAAAAFLAGQADFLETPAQVAEALVDAGAVIVREMGRETGPIPYSSYSAHRAVLDNQTEALSALIRAHAACLAWMRSVSGAEIWETIAPSFADQDPVVYRRAVERLHRLGAWSSDATLPRASFDRLADCMQRGGLISRVAPYEACCDDSLTRAVLAAAEA